MTSLQWGMSDFPNHLVHLNPAPLHPINKQWIESRINRSPNIFFFSFSFLIISFRKHLQLLPLKLFVEKELSWQSLQLQSIVFGAVIFRLGMCVYWNDKTTIVCIQSQMKTWFRCIGLFTPRRMFGAINISNVFQSFFRFTGQPIRFALLSHVPIDTAVT